MRAADAAAAGGRLRDDDDDEGQEQPQIHPLTGDAWQDDVERQRRFRRENPDAEITNAPDLTARTARRWDGTLGTLSWTACSLGELLDLMEPAAEERRSVLLAALRARWQRTYRIWWDGEARMLRAYRSGTQHQVCAPSAQALEEIIAADAAGNATGDQIAAKESWLKTRHGDWFDDIGFDAGRWHARRRTRDGRVIDADTAAGLDDLLMADGHEPAEIFPPAGMA